MNSTTATDFEATATTAEEGFASKLLDVFMRVFFGCTYNPDADCSTVDLIVEAAVFVVVFAPIIYYEFMLINYCLQSRDIVGQIRQKFRRDFLDSVRQVEADIKGKCTNHRRCCGGAESIQDDDFDQANLSRPLIMPFASSLQVLNGCGSGGKSNSDAVFHVQLQQDCGMLRIMDPENDCAAAFRALQESSTLCLQMTPCSGGGWSLQGTRISETVVFKINQGHIAPPAPGSDECEAYWVETLLQLDDSVAASNSNENEQQTSLHDIFQRKRYPDELLVAGKFKDTSSSNCFEGEWILSTCALRGRFNIFEPTSSSTKPSSFVNAQVV